jgi:hypothetical protein
MIENTPEPLRELVARLEVAAADALAYTDRTGLQRINAGALRDVRARLGTIDRALARAARASVDHAVQPVPPAPSYWVRRVETPRPASSRPPDPRRARPDAGG